MHRDIKYVQTINAQQTHINWQKKDHHLLVSDSSSKMVIELLESRLVGSPCPTMRGTLYQTNYPGLLVARQVVVPHSTGDKGFQEVDAPNMDIAMFASLRNNWIAYMMDKARYSSYTPLSQAVRFSCLLALRFWLLRGFRVFSFCFSAVWVLSGMSGELVILAAASA